MLKNNEFKVYKLSSDGVRLVNDVSREFDEFLTTLLENALPESSRYTSLVKTKLEEAAFYARKAVGSNPANWEKIND